MLVPIGLMAEYISCWIAIGWVEFSTRPLQAPRQAMHPSCSVAKTCARPACFLAECPPWPVRLCAWACWLGWFLLVRTHFIDYVARCNSSGHITMLTWRRGRIWTSCVSLWCNENLINRDLGSPLAKCNFQLNCNFSRISRWIALRNVVCNCSLENNQSF